MKLIRRCTLRGAVKYILPTILFITILIGFILLFNANHKLRETNNALVNTIEELEAEVVDLSSDITRLEEENKKLLEEKDVLMQQTQASGVFKSYTDYKCLSRNSKQWSMQKQAYTDKNGLRKIGDAYLVALGSYYGTKLGTKYEVTLSNGSTFKIILCDCKKDMHTDKQNKVTVSDGSILEFYVDTSSLPKRVKRSGTISSIDFFSGGVVSITQIK